MRIYSLLFLTGFLSVCACRLFAHSAERPANPVDQQMVVVEIYLYDDSAHTLKPDSLHNAVVTATERSTTTALHAATSSNGHYEFILSPFKIYSIQVEKNAYTVQQRTVRTDGSGLMVQRYYLFRPGVPFYYTNYGMQVPYNRNDQYIGILRNAKCTNSCFEQFISDLGLVKCAGDSVQLYRKANGLPFHAVNDTVLFQLRTATDKIDVAGPVIGPVRSSPLMLTGRIKIYFLTEENHVQEKDKAELNSMLYAKGFKADGAGWYTGPAGIGAELNSIVDQIHQLPFVWFAIAESVEHAH